jgi:hypothetical protein
MNDNAIIQHNEDTTTPSTTQIPTPANEDIQTPANQDIPIIKNDIKIKKNKIKKEEFNAECDHCSKTFKSKLLYDKHTIQQLCYSEDEITYCKICNETLVNVNDYKKHLFTMNHLNNIGYNNIEKLQNKEVSKVHLADPYLSKTDINSITNTNLGDSFTFVFNKGNTKTVSLVNNVQVPIKELIQDTIIQDTIVQAIIQNQVQDQVQDQVQEQESDNKNSIIEYTPRQLKLILILEKQSNENTPGDSGKNFFKLLDTKLQIEDYKGLQSIINNLNVLDTYKNTYSKVIEIFITMLIKEKNKGEKLYKNKDISQLVINLSS